MKNRIVLSLILLLVVHLEGHAQKYITDTTAVSFYSKAPMEDIQAVNKDASGIFEEGSGEIAFLVPIKKFVFPNALMQEHFNESYLESDKYPNATFKGKIIDSTSTSDPNNKVIAKGMLNIHGVSREVEISGTLQKVNNDFVMKSEFPVKLADYKIKVPKIVFYDISDDVKVTANFSFKPYEK